jgi:hypothetical protein
MPDIGMFPYNEPFDPDYGLKSYFESWFEREFKHKPERAYFLGCVFVVAKYRDPFAQGAWEAFRRLKREHYQEVRDREQFRQGLQEAIASVQDHAEENERARLSERLEKAVQRIRRMWSK